MEYRTLGRGCVVSALCLGTMTFGDETDEAGAHEQLDVFVDAGGTFVDTADVYSAGASEEIVGRWLAARPRDVVDRIVLATKGRFAMGDDPNASAPRGGTCAEHWMTRSRGSASIMSTCISCTRGIRTHPSKRRCASSTTRYAPGRSAIRACRTSPGGRSKRRSTWQSGTTSWSR